jgi:uncharacterized protein
MNTTGILIALAMGLTGSLHCAGMCGPIVWVMPFQHLHGAKRWVGVGLYHLGRISIYALGGFVLHSFKSLFHPQWQQYVSIVMGAILLIGGVVSFIPSAKLRFQLPWSNAVRNSFGKFISNPGLLTLLAAGLMNGLLPCGLEYMALSLSVSATTATDAILYMYAFGIGTLPVLLAITILKTKLRFTNVAIMKRMVPVLLLVFGIVFMVRGMNLGIPYLSPKVEMQQNEIKASCCHKP